jgi:hypothetical protein
MQTEKLEKPVRMPNQKFEEDVTSDLINVMSQDSVLPSLDKGPFKQQNRPVIQDKLYIKKKSMMIKSNRQFKSPNASLSGWEMSNMSSTKKMLLNKKSSISVNQVPPTTI